MYRQNTIQRQHVGAGSVAQGQNAGLVCVTPCVSSPAQQKKVTHNRIKVKHKA
jgi:hypothetical protein